MGPKYIFLILLVQLVSSDYSYKGCQYEISPMPGRIEYIKDRNYPNGFIQGACKWTAKCPINYNCELRCNIVQMIKSTKCVKERILVSRSGVDVSTGNDGYCSSQGFTVTSEKQQLVLALIVSANSTSKLSCQVEAIRVPTEKKETVITSSLVEIQLAINATNNCTFLTSLKAVSKIPSLGTKHFKPCTYQKIYFCKFWDFDCLKNCEKRNVLNKRHELVQQGCLSPYTSRCTISIKDQWIIESADLPYGFGEYKESHFLHACRDSRPCGYTNKAARPSNEGPPGGVLNIYPMMAAIVSLERDKTVLLCEATIIDKRHLLTSGNCPINNNNITNIRVLVGLFETTKDSYFWHIVDQSRSQVYKIEVYLFDHVFLRSPYFNDFDAGLVRVEGNITFSNEVGPACIPHKYVGKSIEGSTVFLLGYFYNLQTSKNIFKLDFNVLDRRTCDYSLQMKNDSSRKMCISPRQQTSREVIGGGIFLKDPSTNSIFLMGIASSRLYNPGDYYYSSYLPVEHMLAWIEGGIMLSEGRGSDDYGPYFDI